MNYRLPLPPMTRDLTWEQRRAEARVGKRVGVTKPTVAARKAKRLRRTQSR